MKRAVVVPGLTPVGGRIAQLVEQLTLNQRVQGSNPCAPTNEINNLEGSSSRLAGRFSGFGSVLVLPPWGPPRSPFQVCLVALRPPSPLRSPDVYSFAAAAFWLTGLCLRLPESLQALCGLIGRVPRDKRKQA